MDECDLARFAWNWAKERSEAEAAKPAEDREWLSGYTLKKLFAAEKRTDPSLAWTTDRISYVHQNAILDFEKARDRWVKWLKGGKKGRRVGAPRWRCKHRSPRSFNPTNRGDQYQVDGKRIKLPKIGWVSMRQELRFAGSIRKVAVKQDRATGRWLACISVLTPKPARPRPGPSA